uniref:G_PROTEIN_RECEP_F1_2 domain-containing protein n=1 Tax=Globodera pallida TaxID=36090 RepID=A0A183CL99_GLOPA
MLRNLNLRVNECTIPSPFFLAAIWLTVYLAVQRYIYICVPKLVQSLCTIRRSKQMIVSICVLSMWVYAPELFASYNQSFQSSNPYTNRTRSMCVMYQTALIQMMGNNLYHMLVFAVHTIIVHTLPCILLVFFTWRLIAAIRKADKKHCNLIGKGNQQHHQQQQQQRKFTVVTPDEGLGGSARGGAGSSSSNGMTPILAGRSSSSEEADESCGGGSTAVVTTDMPTTNSTTLFTRTSQQPQQQQRGSLSESKRVQGLRQNTRMLLAVILLFLVTEIPAALIFGMHVGTVALKFTFLQQRHYAIINKLLIVRNVLIVISYPLRFAIYCGMSAQFREVVQQMLAKRKTLFQHFSYGKLRTRGISGEVRRAGSGRKSEGGESSSNSLAHKTSTTLGMLLQTETVVWRNGVGGDAPLGGRRDEMTRLTMDHHSNGGGGRLAGQTTVLVGDEGTDDDERNVEEDEETDELDANTNYDEHL